MSSAVQGYQVMVLSLLGRFFRASDVFVLLFHPDVK